MPIAALRCHNYKKVGTRDITLNGKSIAVIGDSGLGKSSLMEIAQVLLLLKDFPDNPLKRGTDDGWIEMDFTSDITGLKYTVKRKFDKHGNVSRFSVIDSSGGKHTLTTFIEQILGPAFISQYFDYNKYFIKCASTQARFEYMMSVIGGKTVVDNNTTIKSKIRERGAIGSQRKAQKVLVEQNLPLDSDMLKQKVKLYSNSDGTIIPPREVTEAQLVKDKYIKDNVVDVTDVQKEYDGLVLIKEEINEKNKAITESDNEIKILEDRIIALKSARDLHKKEIDKLQKTKGLNNLDEFKYNLGNIIKDNNDVIVESQNVYEAEIAAIMEFNKDRAEFIQGYQSLREYNRLDKEYKEMTADIDNLKEENKSIFRGTLPIPELSIASTEDGEEYISYTDEEGERELTYDNISRGEGIKLAYSIQKALSPEGDKFVVIHEAQSLGSKLYEILDECNEFGIQVIFELTEPDQKVIRIDVKE